MGDILFLAHRVPYPPDRGDKMRSFHLLRLLSGLGRVHLAAFADDAVDLASAQALRPLVASMHLELRRRSKAAAAVAALATGRPISLAAFASRTMHGAVREALAQHSIDTIFAFSGQMAQYVPPGAERRFVMDFVDVDSAKFDQYADGLLEPLGWLHRREGRLLGRYEGVVARRAAASLFVSDTEAGLFRKRSGLRHIAVTTLENGIDLVRYAPDADFPPLPAAERGEGPLIVFTGQMDYQPNLEAARDFALRVLPEVRRRHPRAHFAIVGRNPPKALARLDGTAGVRVTGAVADVRGWLAAADVVVAPLAIARGVQNKVLEAMAMARPVIASPAAFEGVAAVPGRDLLVAELGAMASAVGALLDDPARRAAIGAAARRLVEHRYDWETRRDALAGIVGRAPAEAAA